jgi:methylenetetrahydrofolate dehydrogenase (NADP+)/methenyltetrahydrofolate cyclohydrolase
VETEMTTKILSGTEVSAHILALLKTEIASFSDADRQPGLATILVGADPASEAYVRNKRRTCDRIGIASFHHPLEASTSEADLMSLIQLLNNDDKVDGILLQLPLPKGLDEGKMLNLIDPKKDVDGFHPQNVGNLVLGLPTYKSCTPAGVLALLEYYKIESSGKHVVVIGRSNIVGKPLANMLIQKGKYADATVTVCHSRTVNLPDITRQADILIAAIGRAQFVTADMVKDGAVVIDVGINRIDDSAAERGYRLVGDVDYSLVAKKTSAITPVPGGIGPMTIAMLMQNTVTAFKRKYTL